MHRIFISHNSSDAREAVAIKQWLADKGWQDTFLDIDGRDGLNPGERWKDALKNAADQCEAVLCLISPAWLESAECKLEFRYAETLRKSIFLALLQPCEPRDLPPDWQWCPLYGEGSQTTIQFVFKEQPLECSFRADGLARLKNGLEKAGIGAKYFPWPPANEPQREPYRGLKPLDTADAAIFFGRETQVLHGMEALRDMRQSGLERWLVILGASGSGKSSFMRAGLLPRLERDDRQFFTLPVIRPRNGVLTGKEGLAPSLQAAFGKLGLSVALGDIEGWLRAGPEAFDALLAKLEQRLCTRFGEPGDTCPPTVVLAIDQAEELFNPDGAEEAREFLGLLRGLLGGGNSADRLSAGGPEARALVLMTIRSDRYERLQTVPELTALKPRLFDLKPFPVGQFERVINGPAERVTKAGGRLSLEPELTERLLADFSEGADTLPLLAFALEKLYLKYGEDGRLTLADYESIRGRHKTVQAALFQEAIDTALAEPFKTPVIPATREEQYEGLRRTFIPFLARIDPATNLPFRKVAPFTDLPADVRPLAERLVQARLLIRDRDSLEVAHESLLRQWTELNGWLTEDRDKLRMLERLREAAAEWIKENRRDDLLVHRDGRLKDAEALLTTPGYAMAADADERLYLKACTAAQQARENAEREEQERRLHEAQEDAANQARYASQMRKAAWVSGVLALVALIGGGFALYNYEGDLASNRAFIAKRLLDKGDFSRALGVAQVAYDVGHGLIPMTPIMEQTMTDGFAYALLEKKGLYRRVLRHGLDVPHAVFSPDGGRVITSSYDGAARLWNMEGRLLKTMHHTDKIQQAAFFHDGSHIVTVGYGHQAKLWDRDGNLVKDMVGHGCKDGFCDIHDIAIAPDDSAIVTVSTDQTAILWDRHGNKLKVLDAEGWIYNAAFSPDGRYFATSGKDQNNTLQIYERDGSPLATLRSETCREEDHWNCLVTRAAFSPTEKTSLLAAFPDRSIRLYDVGGKLLETYQGHQGRINSVSYHPDGKRFVTASDDHTAIIWSDHGGKIPLLKHRGPVTAAVFSPDGKYVATAGQDKTVKLWDLSGNLLISYEGHAAAIHFLAFSPDSQALVTASSDKTARLWRISPNRSPILSYPGPVAAVGALPDGKRLLVAVSEAEPMMVQLWGKAEQEDQNRQDYQFLKIYQGFGADAYGNKRFYSLDVSPDGSQFVTTGTDYTIRVFDVESGAVMREWTQQEGCTATGWCGPVNARYSRDGQYIIVSDYGGYVRIYDRQGVARIAIQAHENEVHGVDMSSDNRLVVTASHDKTIKLWDLDLEKNQMTLRRTFSGHLDAVCCVEFIERNQVLSGSHDATIRIWDMEGHAIYQASHGDAVTSVDFSPEQKRYLSSSRDNTAKVWDMQLQPVRSLEMHTDDVTAARFVPGGEAIVTASQDRRVIAWMSPRQMHAWVERQQESDSFYLLACEDRKELRIDSFWEKCP